MEKTVPQLANKYYENKTSFEQMPNISDADLDKAIEKALQMKIASIKDKKVAKEFEEGVRHNLEKVDKVSLLQNRAMGNLWDDIVGAVPDIHIDNTYMAATIDIIVTGVLVATGVGTVAIALKKYGAEQLKKIFIRTLTTKLIGKAAIALGISLPFIANFIVYVTNPQMLIAEFMDSKDSIPNNGSFDVVW